MGNESTIMVELIVDDKGTVKIKQFERAADQALGQAESKARSAGTAIGGLPVPIGRVGTALGPIAGLVAGAFSVATITEFSRAAVQSASDLEEVHSKFGVVFSAQRTLAGGWAEELHDKYLMSTRAAEEYLASMMDLLGPMGVSSDKAASLSFEITKLGADLASFNNRGQVEVMENLRSALVGEYEAVRKYGIILNDTIVTNEAMRLGLAGTKDAVTAADKAQAAYNLMLKMSHNAIGDVERTTDSYANTTKRLAGNIEDLEAAIGARLMPTLGRLKGALADVIGSWAKDLNNSTEARLRRTAEEYERVVNAIASAEKMGGGGVLDTAQRQRRKAQLEQEMETLRRMLMRERYVPPVMADTGSPFAPPPGKTGTASTSATDVMNEYLDVVTDYSRRRVAIIQQADEEILANTLSGYALQRTQAQRAYDEQLADLADGLNAQAYTWRQFDEANLKASEAFNAKIARINEAERAEKEKQDLESWQRLNATAEEQSGYLVTLSERTAGAIEQNFSDLFFDAFTGKLDSLSDYAEAVFNSIARASSDIMGQMMKDMIFGTGKVGSTGALGGLGDFFDVLFGGMSIGMAGGGTITEPIWGIGKSGRRYRLGENAPGEVEDVIPRSKRGGGGSVVQNQISLTIQAVDAASFAELAGRNPQAIIGPLMEELEGGNRRLRSAIRGSF